MSALGCEKFMGTAKTTCKGEQAMTVELAERGIYAQTTSEHALRQLQFALRDIHEEMNLRRYSVRFKSADISLATRTDVSASGEVTVTVVTVAGTIGVNSTSTLNITLGPPTPDETKDLVDSASENLKALTRHLLSLIEEASQGAFKLEFQEGSVTTEVVVNAQGEIELAAPGILKSILKFFGFDASVSAAAALIKTSSITINFERA
jgi:hypothetical protein